MNLIDYQKSENFINYLQTTSIIEKSLNNLSSNSNPLQPFIAEDECNLRMESFNKYHTEIHHDIDLTIPSFNFYYKNVDSSNTLFTKEEPFSHSLETIYGNILFEKNKSAPKVIENIKLPII